MSILHIDSCFLLLNGVAVPLLNAEIYSIFNDLSRVNAQYWAIWAPFGLIVAKKRSPRHPLWNEREPAWLASLESTPGADRPFFGTADARLLRLRVHLHVALGLARRLAGEVVPAGDGDGVEDRTRRETHPLEGHLVLDGIRDADHQVGAGVVGGGVHPGDHLILDVGGDEGPFRDPRRARDLVCLDRGVDGSKPVEVGRPISRPREVDDIHRKRPARGGVSAGRDQGHILVGISAEAVVVRAVAPLLLRPRVDVPVGVVAVHAGVRGPPEAVVALGGVPVPVQVGAGGVEPVAVLVHAVPARIVEERVHGRVAVVAVVAVGGAPQHAEVAVAIQVHVGVHAVAVLVDAVAAPFRRTGVDARLRVVAVLGRIARVRGTVIAEVGVAVAIQVVAEAGEVAAVAVLVQPVAADLRSAGVDRGVRRLAVGAVRVAIAVGVAVGRVIIITRGVVVIPGRVVVVSDHDLHPFAAEADHLRGLLRGIQDEVVANGTQKLPHRCRHEAHPVQLIAAVVEREALGPLDAEGGSQVDDQLHLSAVPRAAERHRHRLGEGVADLQLAELHRRPREGGIAARLAEVDGDVHVDVVAGRVVVVSVVHVDVDVDVGVDPRGRLEALETAREGHAAREGHGQARVAHSISPPRIPAF